MTNKTISSITEFKSDIASLISLQKESSEFHDRIKALEEERKKILNQIDSTKTKLNNQWDKVSEIQTGDKFLTEINYRKYLVTRVHGTIQINRLTEV